MVFKYISVYCPVGEHTKLGEIVKGQVCSFACTECRWVFTWDAEGKLLAPQPLDRPTKKICHCGGCQYRDSTH